MRKQVIMTNYQFSSDNLKIDSTSTYGFNMRVISVNDNDEINFPFISEKYVRTDIANINVFAKIRKNFNKIKNKTLQTRIMFFIKSFGNILSYFNVTDIPLPSILITIEEDSVFLEWIFMDFRIGFTFCECEEESMWYLVSNKKLDELTVSGSLMETDYYAIIEKLISFVLRYV